MKKIVFILFVFIYPAFAQSDFEFEFDYAQFGYDTSSNYVEFYYSFNEASLKVNSENSNAKIEGLLSCQPSAPSIAAAIPSRHPSRRMPASRCR